MHQKSLKVSSSLLLGAILRIHETYDNCHNLHHLPGEVPRSKMQSQVVTPIRQMVILSPVFDGMEQMEILASEVVPRLTRMKG